MTASAVVYGLFGAVLLFLSKEVLALDATATNARLIAQLLGAAMLGMAAMNWIARGSILGGIYGRAILAGNFTYTFISLLISLRAWFAASENGWLGFSAAFYFILFGGFGFLLFGKPRLGHRKT